MVKVELRSFAVSVLHLAVPACLVRRKKRRERIRLVTYYKYRSLRTAATSSACVCGLRRMCPSARQSSRLSVCLSVWF
jgi:hypothetical protein